MHAFDGKTKSIQYKIASDINSQVVDDSLNVYDLIQGYCADIAAVGDGRQSGVNALQQDSSTPGCGYCKVRGHKEDDCRRKQSDAQNGSTSPPPPSSSDPSRSARFKGKCDYCHRHGHKEADCRTKQRETGTGAPVAAVVLAPTTPPSSPVTAVSQNHIQALINHLQSTQNAAGILKVNMIKSASHTDPESANNNSFAALAVQ